ncbi:hypothetical protein F8M41_014071 [Gigaspora margarita]|uniref:Uncharacterized protein n=1 Tax=Gigaspora margarita TaxID=4874 RepID=A0A8H4ENS9_GIGMA|nr:hypothetical protein F8M41_014071 [Gigaspora margarita]
MNDLILLNVSINNLSKTCLVEDTCRTNGICRISFPNHSTIDYSWNRFKWRKNITNSENFIRFIIKIPFK